MYDVVTVMLRICTASVRLLSEFDFGKYQSSKEMRLIARPHIVSLPAAQFDLNSWTYNELVRSRCWNVSAAQCPIWTAEG